MNSTNFRSICVKMLGWLNWLFDFVLTEQTDRSPEQ